ncbi:MAG: hypothetical protein KDB22_27035, partial [Planctomycetales bacterium]|nr:hypothetical protein [Planctomycetales bacterium]
AERLCGTEFPILDTSALRLILQNDYVELNFQFLTLCIGILAGPCQQLAFNFQLGETTCV